MGTPATEHHAPDHQRGKHQGDHQGALAARWAGGAAVMVIVAGAMVGLVVAGRTGRLYAGFGKKMAETQRAAATGRLTVAATALAAEVARADEVDDWTELQARLPKMAAKDELTLSVTDADGLVLADADPAHNGQPLADDRLAQLGANADATPHEMTIGGRPVLVAVARAHDARLVWAIGSLRAEREMAATLDAELRSAIRLDWALVGLGTLVALVVSVGAVLLVAGGVARGLRAVAWRIGELGRGDYSTHLEVDGPAELQLVGDELALAARRIDAAAQARTREAALEAGRATQRAVLAAALEGPRTFGTLDIAAALAPASASSCACALGTVPRADGAVVVFIEIASSSFEDALLAAQLRACATALLRDEALSPSDALRRMDVLLPPERRARACVVAMKPIGDGAWSLQLALAGARAPLHRGAGGTRALDVFGDRLGEPGAVRGAEIQLTLAQGERVVLLGDAPLDGGRALDGHAGRALRDQIAALTVSPEEMARELVAQGAELRPTVAVVIGS